MPDKKRRHEEKYHDGQLLSAAQVAEIWSGNSEKQINPNNVAAIAARRGVKSQKIGASNAYPYEQVRNIVVKEKGRGAKSQDANALARERVRRMRARRAADGSAFQSLAREG